MFTYSKDFQLDHKGTHSSQMTHSWLSFSSRLMWYVITGKGMADIEENSHSKDMYLLWVAEYNVITGNLTDAGHV